MTTSARLYGISMLAAGSRTAAGIARMRASPGAQLRRLVRHAHQQVPFYRDLYDLLELSPAAIQCVSDLTRLPVVSKRELQMAGVERRLARWTRGKRLFTRSTSGSTGEPMVVCCTWFEESLLSCLRALVKRRLGVRSTDHLVRLKVPLASRRRPRWVSRLQSVGFHRETAVDCLLPPDEILSRVRDLAPNVLGGFPGILASAAEINEGRSLPSLRFVISGGETLDPLLRRRIERGFGVPVRDTYASHEVGQIAAQCERGRLHVCEEIVLLEILKDGVPVAVGESGEVVVTGLHSLAMPFLRYRLGDVATRGPDVCECGRDGATLESIHGRTADFLVLEDGRELHSFRLILELSHDFDLVSRYRLLQEARGRVRLEIVPAVPIPASRLDALRNRLRAVARDRLKLDLALVEEISPGPHGKSRICASQVSEQGG